MAIYTHMNVDLDAVASVWAARRFIVENEAPVKFVPANFDGTNLESTDIAVDIFANGKGIKGDAEGDNYVGSAFSKIVQSNAPAEAIEALKPLILYVDLQDNTGSAVRSLVVDCDDRDGVATLEAASLTSVLNAVKSVFSTDEEVVDYMSTIFEGMLETGLSRMRCVREAKNIQLVDDCVAIVREPKEPGINAYIFSNFPDVQAIVFVDGNNLGVVRRNTSEIRLDARSITILVEEADEESDWFFHPAGFLAAHGTKKAPAEKMSAITPERLATAVAFMIRY